MAKVYAKLGKQVLSELAGSLNKSEIGNDKKLLGLFDLINTHQKDDKIDVKEITDFTVSVFSADADNNGEVDCKELEVYIKANEDKFKNLKIKAKDIMKFLRIFAEKADKTDGKNQRITNADGSYSIIYEDVEVDSKTSKQADNCKIVTKKVNYNKDNSIATVESTFNNERIIRDKDEKILTKQQLKDDVVVSEQKSDGLTYYYDANKTTIKKWGTTLKEIEILESGKRLVKEYKAIDRGKTIVNILNEENNEKSCETIYEDDYYVKLSENKVISLRDIKTILNNSISYETYSDIDYMGKDAIASLSQEDDINFQKTYITSMVDKIIELAELVGVDANDVRVVQKEIQEKGFENVSVSSIHKAYSQLFMNIKKSTAQISESKICNKYYTSKHSYTKIVRDDKIIITDSENVQTVIDKNKLLSVYASDDKEVMWSVIRDLPAEVLKDMSEEVTFENIKECEGASGSFDFIVDRINIGDIVDIECILHEIGHAIDCVGAGSEYNYQTVFNTKFSRLFMDEMQAFEKAGNKRCVAYYNSKGEYIVLNDKLQFADTNQNSTYATLDGQEMFAECYALLMNGESQSEELISKYFPKTLNCVLEMVESTREIPKSQKHPN